jgi:tRNA A37 threonylcarbamoyladenosine biosynthesis protein TsaE
VVVEWPSRVEALLTSARRINIHLTVLSAHNRRIRIER